MCVAEHLLDIAQLLAEHRGDDLELLVDVLGVGLGEDGADRCGDHLGVAIGTTARTLRMKCTRQRCHAAPISTEVIAVFGPVWASLITSWVPPSPRAFRPRRNAIQERCVLRIADIGPEHRGILRTWPSSTTAPDGVESVLASTWAATTLRRLGTPRCGRHDGHGRCPQRKEVMDPVEHGEPLVRGLRDTRQAGRLGCAAAR